jgi:hypothetical protein
MEEALIEAKPKGKPGRKPRERSAAGLSVDEAHREGITMGDDRDPNTAVEQERVRIPLNSGQKQSLRGYKLDWNHYQYRWFHESATRGGRVVEAEQAFYEKCVDGEGNAIRTPSGAGWDYLMRLPKKYWLEDMAASRARRNKLRQSTQELKGDGKIQEYGVDTKTGRPVFDGETPVKRSSSVAPNPYSE